MKVIVKNKYLNVRVGKPSVNAPCYQYIAPGSEIEVDGQLYKGDSFDGIDIWMKDGAGNYYWSGGVCGSDLKMIKGKSTFKWFNQLGIEDVWEEFNEKGKLAKIAILDTGYNANNIEVSQGVVSEKILIDSTEYLPQSLVIQDRSGSAHGNRCASLVGCRNSSSWIVGIAPECEMIVGKISVNRELRKIEYLLNGIEWAINEKCDIISISYAYEFEESEKKYLEERLSSLLAKNEVIVFASSGNTDGTKTFGDRFPASFPYCCSIGATDENKQLSLLTLLSSQTFLHAPGINIESYGKSLTPEPESGTSFSTPIAAGITALAVSYLKKHNKPIIRKDLIDFLKLSGDSIQENKKFINISNLFKTYLK